MMRLVAGLTLCHLGAEAVGGPGHSVMRREADGLLIPATFADDHHSNREQSGTVDSYPYESMMQDSSIVEEGALADPAPTASDKAGGDDALPNPNLGPPEGWQELNLDRNEALIFARGMGTVFACAVAAGALAYSFLTFMTKMVEHAKDSGAPDEPLMEDGKLSNRIRFAFCLPTMATLPVTALIAVFVLSFYSRRGADLPSMALAVALARSMDVVTDPLMSHLTDSWRHSVGRRRFWIIVAAPFYGVFLMALLSPPYLREVPLAAWFAIMYIGFFLTNTIANIPYDAWAPELSEDSNERTRLFFLSGLFDGCGTLLAFFLPFVGFKIAKGSGFTEDICVDPADVALRCANGLTCVLFSENGPGFEWALNTTFRHYYGGDVKDIMKFDCTTNDPKSFAKSASDITAYSSYCDCISQCNQACSGANRSWGFAITGMVFCVWYVFSAYICCYYVKERPSPAPADDFRKSQPLVPAVLNTLNNPAFRTLLPAWACDAVSIAVLLAVCPFFVMYVVAPEYQTASDSSFGLDCREGSFASSSSPHYDRRCNTMVILGVSVSAALGVALLFTPLWLLLVQKKGKYTAWLTWSFCMSITNFFFFIMNKGWVVTCIIGFALSGIPLGAKFLADSILADIIDYDEFLTGSRNEAMYTMFKSFLPKVMALPATAIPLYVMNAAGHISSVNGKIMYQPEHVRLSIRVMAGIVTSLASFSAFLLKRQYLLHSDEIVAQVSEGIRQHKQGKTAKDPLCGLEYIPTKFTEEESAAGIWNLQHFVGVEIIESMAEDPDTTFKDLQRKATIEVYSAAAAATLCVFGMLSTIPLIKDRRFAIIPTLLAVCLGVSLTTFIFCYCRFRAANEMADTPPDPEIVKKVLRNRQALKVLEEGRIDLQASEPVEPVDAAAPASPAAPAGPAAPAVVAAPSEAPESRRAARSRRAAEEREENEEEF